ncbi:MAG: hypothetical protein MSIBF_04660 [Candidatus Altiarchaeales archaeon IMC4]|nr:MAG: hypothetical protein MSIBF_04660 [Candidatus Altiarchaeales archaeon IMC4]
MRTISEIISDAITEKPMDTLKRYIEEEIGEVVNRKMIEPLDLIRRKIMFGLAFALTMTFGFAFIFAGVLLQVLYYVQKMPMWITLLIIGLMFLLVSMILYMKLKSIKPKEK